MNNFNKRKSRDWWQEAFGKGWYPLPSISKEWSSKTLDETQALIRILGLKPGMKLLDVCCGVGRHSKALANQGLEVAGIDVSKNYIAQAKRQSKGAHFLVRDMRTMGFHNEFDSAINLFSSFGYFDKASDDLKALKEIYRAIKPGGLFLIDNMDHDWLKKNFVANQWVELSDGTLILEKRSPLDKKRIARTDWTFVAPDGNRSYMHSAIRAYNQNSLTRLMKHAGFKRVTRLPNLSNQALSLRTSARLVLMAEK